LLFSALEYTCNSPWFFLFQFGKKEMRILMVGLDAAGKTTILYKLKLGEGKQQLRGTNAPLVIREFSFSPLTSPHPLYFSSCDNDPYHWFQRRNG
jgi:hypothetical protein